MEIVGKQVHEEKSGVTVEFGVKAATSSRFT